MKYSVTWTKQADDDLTRIWTSAKDKNAVTSVANRLEKQFASDPLDLGESREDDLRLVIVAPLQIVFRVVNADRRVYVLKVGRA